MDVETGKSEQLYIKRSHVQNIGIKSNQIIFIGLRSSKDYYKRPGGVGGGGGGGYGARNIWGWVFYVDRCVLKEWVVGGGGLDGYFGEQGLPVGIQ